MDAMGSWVEFSAIKQAVPLMKVLQGYGMAGLRRSGKDQWRGRCPLHGGEERESFHVNTAKQLFHCFSCGAGGTVLDLVAAVEGCGLREAAERLAVGGILRPPSRAGKLAGRHRQRLRKKERAFGR
jgi:DNA primase